MQVPFGYTIKTTIHHGHGAIVYRAERRSDGRPVILKMLGTREVRPRDIERLRHELELGKELDIPAVVRPLALESYDGLPVLVLEDFGGSSLDQLMGTPWPIERLLDLAIRIARAVAELHKLGVIHKDLKPENILVEPVSGEVKLSDLGIATRLPREQLAPRVRMIEGSLPYMAPEQTGRTNRAVDARSDLYSLGVVLYELATGRRPFHAADPVEWVHCHIAQAPEPAVDVVPSLPPVVSAIIERLLAKAPEARYQSAAGLVHDLEQARARLDGARIAPFPLATRDFSDRFEIPPRLYGRQREIAALVAAFERVAATGAPEVVVIAGYSGIGKSSLVAELGKPVARHRAFFVSGKFDQYNRDTPYASVVQAFRQLALELLTESEDQLAEWRQRLTAALGLSGKLITDLIPEIGMIIGPQPALVELSLGDARTRLHETFRQFVGVFTAHNRPVVLFLDDLGWADLASLDLLEDLITHDKTRSLCAIFAYRDNEVTAAHPLMQLLGRLKHAAGAPGEPHAARRAVTELVLAPLTVGDVAQLTADTLHTTADAAAPLARVLHEKSGGNPFFVIQLLTTFYRDGLITADPAAMTWQWDVERIRTTGYTDNVGELMANHLLTLPAATQEVLRLAACAGNVVELGMLAMISERTEAGVVRDLEPARRDGLIVVDGGCLRFMHDRVQHAAYTRLLASTPPGEVHLRIGRLLLRGAAPADVDRHLFEIANHLTVAAALISDPEEKATLARINLLAGQRAKAQTAYAQAIDYLSAGMAALESDCWDRSYEIAFALYLDRTQCEYLAGHFDQAEALLAELKRHARGKIDLADVHRVEVDAVLTRGDIARAVEAALAGLRPFGIEMSAHPSFDEVRAIHDRITDLMAGRPIEDLLALPVMTDPEVQAAMRLLAVLYAPAFFTDNHLLYLHLGHMVELSLRHGNTAASVSGYAWYGFTLTVGFHQYDEGFRFAKLAYRLMERDGHLAFKPVANMAMEMLSYWNRPIDEMIDYCRVAFESAAQTGNLPVAGYACNHLVMDLLDRGDPLEAVYRESVERLAWVRNASYDDICDIIVSIQRYIQNMRGLTEHFSTFRGPDFDEHAFEARLTEGRMNTLLCWHDLMKLMARFMSGDYEEAVAAGERARTRIWSSLALVQYHDFHFYFPLACAARIDEAAAEQRPHLLASIEQCLGLLREWADHCPANFLPSWALVSAELARLRGDASDAIAQYERAIQAARDGGFVQTEALANELAARFCEDRGFSTAADAHLRAAHALYARWGAEGKVRQLEARFPRLRNHRPLAPTATFVARADQLDLLSVIKASQTISSELVLGDLVRTLLEVVVEQAAAQRGCLLLAHHAEPDQLRVEAEILCDEAGRHTRVLHSAPLADAAALPLSVLNYVRRTGQRVVVDTGTVHSFASDPYFARAKPRSVLCLPILRQAAVVGLLVLQNDLVEGAFTPDRLAVLELLASQAAISLENAQFVEREHAARAAAERAELRSSFLAEASALLSAPLEDEPPATRITELALGLPADWCTFDLLDDDGELRRLAARHRDASLQPVLDEMVRRYPPRRDRTMLGTTEPPAREALLPLLIDSAAVEQAVAPDQLALLDQLGVHSVLIVPLSARRRVLGRLTLSRGATRPPFDPSECELARELGHRVAIAVDNAALYKGTQQAVRARDDFLSVASHELRTPMTSLKLSLDMLQMIGIDTKGDPRATRLMELVYRQRDRLDRLIGDLLDATRVANGRLELEPCELDLSALLRDVAGRFELDLRQSGSTLTLPPGEPIVGHWDRSYLEQVVTNLISNAIKFGQGKPITVALAAQGPRAELTITDQGIGIPPDRARHIFDRFERAVSARHYGGLGLGLYISRRIIEAHGGTIRFDSTPGEGTQFLVELPLVGPS